MKRYSQAGTTMVPDCTSLDGKQSGMWVKYEDVEVLLAELNLLRSQVRNSRVPEAATARVDDFILSKAEEQQSLLRRIADANVIFPSMCPNNMEAWNIAEELKKYRSSPQEETPK